MGRSSNKSFNSSLLKPSVLCIGYCPFSSFRLRLRLIHTEASSVGNLPGGASMPDRPCRRFNAILASISMGKLSVLFGSSSSLSQADCCSILLKNVASDQYCSCSRSAISEPTMSWLSLYICSWISPTFGRNSGSESP